MKINLFHITRDYSNLGVKDLSIVENLSAPHIITPILATKLLDPIYRSDDMSIAVRMMYS